MRYLIQYQQHKWGGSIPQLRKTISKPLSLIWEGRIFISQITLIRWLHIVLLGQFCSRTPGDYPRAEGRSEKAKLLNDAGPPTGQRPHRRRKYFWPTISCDRSPSPNTTEGGRAGSKNEVPTNCKARWTRGQQGGRHPTGRPPNNETILEPSRIVFRYSLDVLRGTNEAGRFSLRTNEFDRYPSNKWIVSLTWEASSSHSLDYVSRTRFRINP